ncbi:Tigger transposable element-derived protein 4 [Trichinella papuae]|uniref:Tigger transposable element-derived protein 4 n=1 Tax=Trichinella papuae TaxID=268474 RepID=A0A0V1MEM5_9BILA|nr:Tigger transposable element-derived protein 4 [Trichinella papuae]
MSQRTKRVAPSRKLKTLSIGSKIELLDALMSKKSTKKELAAQYGVALSTISRIVKNEKEIQSHQLKNLEASKQRFRKRRFDMIDRAVDVWFTQMKSKSAVITGPMNWKFSYFCPKMRTMNQKSNGRKMRSQFYCEAMNPEIFSALSNQSLPNHMLAVKGSSVCGGKTVKDRWTVVLFCNMGSTEKHVYVIGKSRKPRCFCNKKLPLPYYSNIKSWMTSSILYKILVKMDKTLAKQKRKIILFADNSPCHKIRHDVVLHNIEMRFLPTNTCCVTQPLEQCVIRSFKAYYRACMVRKQLLVIEQGKSVIEFANTVTVVSAMLMIKQAWESVAEVTIRNCF